MGYVYSRGRKLYIGYTDAEGRQRQKATRYNVGDEAKAAEVLRQVEAAIAARKEYVPEGGPLTLERFADRWIEQRRKRGVSTVDDDKTRLKKHVLPALGAMPVDEVRPRHIRTMMAELSVGALAPRTQSNVLATVRALFRDAVADEVISTSPVVLKKHETPTRKDADPRWRVEAKFSGEELKRIVRTEQIPEDRRVLYALMGLAGLRFGEAAALRWGDLMPEQPLARLWVAVSYSTKKKREKGTKTESPRGVPVIPDLAELLKKWREEGWREMLGRHPTESDLIIPSRRGVNRSANHMLKKLHQDLDRLKMPPRRQHDFRRTFISLCRSGGAREDLLRFITHGPSGSVMDTYTTLPWETLCDQAHGLHLQLTYSRSKVLDLQGKKWRGGRDLNVYARQRQRGAVAGDVSYIGDFVDVSISGQEGRGTQFIGFGRKHRKTVSTVSEGAQALAARILELAEVQLYFHHGDSNREQAVSAIERILTAWRP